MQRIHLSASDIHHSKAQIQPETHHHLFTVCKLQKQDNIEIVVDSTRLLTCEILSIFPTAFEFKIIDQFSIKSTRNIPITIIQSLPKQDKLTTVCKLCTETGVSNIYPVITDYCSQLQLSDHKFKRILNGIESAAKQSKQTQIPSIHKLSSLKECLLSLDLTDTHLNLVAFEGSDRQLSSIIQSCDFQYITIAIGPEGGFSNNDILTFQSFGFLPFSLGASILRTEHAGFAAINYLDGYLHASNELTT